MPSELSILPAQHGGYIVLHRDGSGHLGAQPLFAGSLPDALEFMRAQFTERASRPEA